MIDKITGNAIGNSAVITNVIADLSVTEIKLANNSVDISNLQSTVLEQVRVIKLTTVTYAAGVSADSNGGEIITLAGEGFASGARVYVGNTECTTTFISSEYLQFLTPSKPPAVYWLTVSNPDGGSVTKPDAIVFGGAPSWITPAGNLGVVTNFLNSNISLQAVSLGTLIYSIDGGSLPPGITLSSNGIISGLLTSGPGLASSYFFNVRATSSLGPYSTRSFFLLTSLGLAVNNILYPNNYTAVSTVGGDSVTIIGSNFHSNINVFVQGTSVSFTRPNSSFISFSLPPLNQARYPATASTRTETYNFASNGIYTFTPTIAGNLSVIMWGAGGGSQSGTTGGAGGSSSGFFYVYPGTTYVVLVGQGGKLHANNFNLLGFPGRGGFSAASGNRGGTGGGFSGLFANTIGHASAIMMAGGGGGGVDFSGGAGGGVTGQAGLYGNYLGAYFEGGGGGTQSAGGSGANGADSSSASGLVFVGGYSVDVSGGDWWGGGGGGGGYFGGGAGASGGASRGAGGGGSGYINANVVLGGNTQVGNYNLPGNMFNAFRGDSGNSTVDGRVVLSFTYATSTDVLLTNPDGQVATATVRYSAPPNIVKPNADVISLAVYSNPNYSTNISVVAGTSVTYSLIDGNYYPWLQFNSSTGTIFILPSTVPNTTYVQGTYPVNIQVTNTENISSSRTYNIVLRDSQFANLYIDYLLVGGGGGGSLYGGGGGGGIVSGNSWAILGANLEATSYSIVVGQGGISGTNATPGLYSAIYQNNQILASAQGGGGGGSGSGQRGQDGASTGGGSNGSGAAGALNIVGQGNLGGAGNANAGGGGGGAGGAGTAATNPSGTVWQGGSGGIGSNAYTVWGLATGTGQLISNLVYYAGGGGGAGIDTSVTPNNWIYPGPGGLGGGGSAVFRNNVSAYAISTSGVPNTGGGGGAGSTNNPESGGSGLVIIRYLGEQVGTGGTVTSAGGYTYHTFTNNGIFNPYGLLTGTANTAPIWLSPIQGNLGTYLEGINFSANLSSVGMSGNVIYTLAAGNLPANIVLASNIGRLSGTFVASSAGNNVFTINSVDAVGRTRSRTFFINVIELPKITNVVSNTTAITSNIGPGDLVTISGSGFQTGALVQIGNTFVVPTSISSNTITLISPIISDDLDYNEGGNAQVSLQYWSPTTTFQMTNFGGIPNMIAHGYNAATTFTFSYPSLPPHDQIRYSLRWHLVDSLDNETNFLNIDGVRYLTFTKIYNAAPSISFSLMANAVFTVSSYSYRPWANGSYGQDGYIEIDTGWINHTASNLAVQHYIGADQAQTDEAEYLSNVRLQTRNISGIGTGGVSNVRIINTASGGIGANFAVTFSRVPGWVTPEGPLPDFLDTNFSTNITISTTSNSTVSVVGGELPPGLTATVTSLTNVNIFGNVSTNANSLYYFTLRLTDLEGQSANRTYFARVKYVPKVTSVLPPPGGFFDPRGDQAVYVFGKDFITGARVLVNNLSQTTTFVNSQCLTYTTRGETLQTSLGGTVTFNTAGLFTWAVPADAVVATVYLWGAGGGGGGAGGWSFGAPGGGGGAARGNIVLTPSSNIFITVGGGGVYASTVGAIGGGGRASVNGVDNRYGAGGGGYSAIFSSNVRTQANTIIMAGGGGGGGSSRAGTGNQGGAGGGVEGQDGVAPYDGKTAYRGRGGTQSAAGVDASSDSANTAGNQGALQGGNPRTNSYGGAGGGGYWGGSAGGYSESNTMGGGGGGSGYLNTAFVTDGALTTGSLTLPGDAGNALRGTAGTAGGVASTGSAGAVVIQWYRGVSTTSYSLYVENPDGLRSSGNAIIVTPRPVWGTPAGSLGSGTVNSTFSTTLSASGDRPITFSVINNTRSLPIQLNAQTGNISIQLNTATVGNIAFTVRATDANLQYTDREFSVTTVLTPVITSISYPLMANSAALLPNTVLSGVTITGTSGQFSATPSSISPGDRILISGVPTGSGSITGYTNPRIYWVATSTTTANFVLANSATGESLVTTVGNTAGLSFTRIPFVANPQSNVFSTMGGETVTVTGRNFSVGAQVAISNITPISGNAIVQRRISTTFVSNGELQFVTPSLQSGFYNLFVLNSNGLVAQSPATMRFSTPPIWVTFQGNLGNFLNNVNLNVPLSAVAESNVTYTLFNSTTLVSNVTLNALTGVITGVPNITGGVTANFTVAATNEEGQFATRNFFIFFQYGYTVQYIVVAGGGSGGQNPAPQPGGVGGGGSGTVYAGNANVVSGQVYGLGVGGGGSYGNGIGQGSGSSGFGASVREGAGGPGPGGRNGNSFFTGSGGSAWSFVAGVGGTGAGGTAGLGGGFNGAPAWRDPANPGVAGGGAGGAGAPGNPGISVFGGGGGNGFTWVNGTAYGGGGGGDTNFGNAGQGGAGGGGSFFAGGPGNGAPGFGGGGGGGGGTRTGGSGVVIVRYAGARSTQLGGNISTPGDGYTYHTFLTSGSFTA